ncbi:tyrosine-type recombinase/integrase [Streptomyces lycii]|uniref:Site-specific integrase n=1 Tax=Streptomyces lycii TaxID=2654337 RepID=A0ABQ7FFZ8_9ACTN|nr:site-specific integrase [Streptomyces lycii]KAF4407949.1 site-specific integrase [Streptomyces lycii]
MSDADGLVRNPASFVVPQTGRLEETGEVAEPYRLLDSEERLVVPAAVFFADLQAASTPSTTIRSYGMGLLRWYRFLWAVDVPWNQAIRVEARDFSRRFQLAGNPLRVHWRHQRKATEADAVLAQRGPRRAEPGTPNPVTGRPAPSRKYAASTKAHSETVLRAFYDFHLEEGTGPIVNPFPLDRSRRAGRAHAHHNPMDSFRSERQGRYRPKVPKRIPRRTPDELFNALFAALKDNRDRALLASWVSTGARAEELLTSREKDALPGQQLIGVTRKGTRAYQQLPASTDAFVWLRLAQEEAWSKGTPRGRNHTLWWTLRRPWRPVNYHAARAMLNRANGLLGSNWTLHDLRHTAAYRMARDPQMSLTDVQWVLGHAHLSTTEIYLAASQEKVIEQVLAHHARRERQPVQPPTPAPGHNAASLDVLSGQAG